MYCGRLQKNANIGDVPLIWVMYLILTYLPLMDGGGKLSIMGSITSFSLEVGIFLARSAYTFSAVSITFKTLCFSVTEVNTVGISVNGATFSRIISSKTLVVLLFFSIKSHLFTTITMPFLFFSAK